MLTVIVLCLQSVGNRVGVTEPFLMRMAHGVPMGSNKSRWSNNKRQNQHGMSSGIVNSDDQTLRVCKRFYVALILLLLVQVLFSSIWTQISPASFCQWNNIFIKRILIGKNRRVI